MAWALSDIAATVRKLTASPDETQLTTQEIYEEAERAYTEDLPALINVEEMDDWYYLYTRINVESYGELPSNYAYKGGVTINGSDVPVYFDPQAFYADYPLTIREREQIGTGDGATVQYTGTLDNQPLSPTNFTIDDDFEILAPFEMLISDITTATTPTVTMQSQHLLSTGDEVMFQHIATGMTQINGMTSKITKTSNTAFTLDDIDTSGFTDYLSGGSVQPLVTLPLKGNQGGTGTVNLTTGAYDVTFANNVNSSQLIYCTYEPFKAGRPQALLINGRDISVRPQPNGTYHVRIGVTETPAPFLRNTDGDILGNSTLIRDDWGRLIAYITARHILNERGQQPAALELEGAYMQQLELVQTRFIRNYVNQRSMPSF